jgi:hypothetical protein
VWLLETPPFACKVVLVKVLASGQKLRYPALLRTDAYADVYTEDKVVKDKPDWRQRLRGQWESDCSHMIEKCCLPGVIRITTERGSLHIRDIVNNRLPVKVRSIDLATGQESWQPVVNWWRNGPASEWVRVWTPNGSRGNKPLRLTADHPVWTPTGWRDAGDLAAGDLVAVASPVLSAEQEQVVLGGLLGDGSLGGRKRPSSLPFYTEAHGAAQRGYLEWKAAALASLGVRTWERQQDDGTGKRHPTAWMRTLAVPALYRFRGQKPAEWLAGLDDLGFAVWFMDDGSFVTPGHGSDSLSLALHCCGFGAEFADAAVPWLESRYGVTAKVLRRDRNPIVVVGTGDSPRLFAALAPYVRRGADRQKVWVAAPVAQGHAGMAFVPVLAAERVIKDRPEQRYDIEVADTHTFIAGGMVLSNCEAFASRRAAPQDLGGLYITDEMQHPEPGPRRQPPTVATVVERDGKPVDPPGHPGSATDTGSASAAPAAGSGTPEEDPDLADQRDRAMNRLFAQLRSVGWDGEDEVAAAVRRSVMAHLGRERDDEPPLGITSLTQLDAWQAQRCADGLRSFIQAAHAEKKDPHDALAALAAEVDKQRAAAGRARGKAKQ